ncbi:MAG: hypothetical protein J6A33_01495 [Alphaproteobacteria bacterium]|nr:hypothetical protein [Alphaproteobacteria bacterium]
MADTKTTTTTNSGTTQQAAQPRQTSANTTTASQPKQPVSTATRQPESQSTMRISEADAKGAQTATNDLPKQADTLGISEGEKNLTVEGATQEQPKEKGRITAESAKGLTIDEINHKLLVDSLDAPERNALEEQKKNLEDKEAPEIQNRDGEQPKGKEPQKGPFKEDDIIKYMYTDWLIGGANWLWAKGAEKLDAGYFATKQALQKTRQKKREASGKTPDKTTQQKEKIDKYADDKSLNKTKEMEEHDKQLPKDLKAAMAGNYDETTFSPETKRFLENIPEHPDPNDPKKTKKDFLKDLGKGMKNLRQNLTNIEQSSALIAQAQMAAELHADPDAFKGADPEKLFEAYQKKAKILIAKQCDKEQKAGRDPIKFLNETLKTAQKARDRADANHDKGHYIENGKEPRDNPSLDKIKETLGWDKAPANDNQQNNEPKGLFQEAVEGKNVEQLMMGQLAQKDNELVTSTKRRINNIDRRGKLTETYEKMLANLDRKENLTAQEQQRYANIQGKLATLRATEPVSGVVEADRKAQQIINKNEKQAQDKAVRNRQMAEMLGGMDR